MSNTGNRSVHLPRLLGHTCVLVASGEGSGWDWACARARKVGDIYRNVVQPVVETSAAVGRNGPRGSHPMVLALE